MVARAFLKISFQAWLMTWWLNDSSQFSPPLAPATAFFHRCCLPRLFIFPEKQERTRRQVARRKTEKDERRGSFVCGPGILSQLGRPKCRVVWYAMVSYVASRRSMRNAISMWRSEEDSVHIRATYETQCTERWMGLAKSPREMLEILVDHAFSVFVHPNIFSSLPLLTYRI